jgi:hypothetical protein
VDLRIGFTGSTFGSVAERIRSLQTHPPIEKLPMSTAILSHVALALLLWNFTLRLDFSSAARRRRST